MKHARDSGELHANDCQAWFWAESWQEGEREASHEREACLGQLFHSDDDFLASLRSDPRR